MKKELRVCLLFGLSQLILSIVIWGSLEYSIMAGDMAQSAESSAWAFIFGSRLLPYTIASLVNAILFRVLLVKFRSTFHPDFGVAVALAASTVALAILLSLNSPFRVPTPFVSFVGFIMAWIVYLVLSLIKRKRHGPAD